MSSSVPPPRFPRLIHSALAPAAGLPLARARLTDRQKMGLILEAAGLLSLLARAGWSLSQGWETATVSQEGRLTSVAAAPVPSLEGTEGWLADLVTTLFGQEPIAGRGQARRSVRILMAALTRSFAPLPADFAVSQTLEAAPFLWQPGFAEARRALVGELHRADGTVLPWVAGPAGFRRRLLGEWQEASRLADALASPSAHALWEREEEGDPAVLAAAGKWRAAVALWQRRPPASEAERIACARCLWALGRFEEALEKLGEARSPEARVLAARCQLFLGRLGAVRATLSNLNGRALPAGEVAEAADVAVRAYTNSGEPELAHGWVERALEAKGGERERLLAHLVAAAYAWDRRDRPVMAEHLVAARGALADPGLAWRWHHVHGLLSLHEGEGGAAVSHLVQAIRASRRALPRHQAAGLWNDLGLGRAAAGDLPGAERAFLHALHLFGTCEGQRRTTLALANLAEIRVRRGRLAGVREILERSTLENRRSGNVRGWISDMEMWARFELAAGRAEAALATCRRALAEGEEKGDGWHREELCALALRALGWLGRAGEAAGLAADAEGVVAAVLEPEERPALWALVGDHRRAGEAAARLREPWSDFWGPVLAGEPVEPPAWQGLDTVEPFRAARAVFDLELAAPGTVPADRLRRAVEVLRRTGALPLAERLEARLGGPWVALAAYLAAEPGVFDLEALNRLLEAAGYPDAAFGWAGEPGLPAESGEDCGGRLAAEVDAGVLCLSATVVDDTLRALFALAVRDGRLAARPPREAARTEPGLPAPPGKAEMVGESPAFRAACARLDLLAPADIPVLILGESGTGKELAARRIHHGSPRARRPFLAVNCAALSETLILSDLFGHGRGAFTGADRDRAGVFEAAEGGTVFLDEIGDLPLPAQGMLLRILQEGELRRLGESLPRRVDVRVLAATHQDLPRMVEAGTFRRDLYFRLRVGSVQLPPLRDRSEDLEPLAQALLRQKGLHARGIRLSPAALAALRRYDWPGNVRELENVLRLAAALAGGDLIRPDHLDLPVPLAVEESSYHQQVDMLRRRLVADAMTTAGSRTEAARRLGLSRQALSYLVRQLGLS